MKREWMGSLFLYTLAIALMVVLGHSVWVAGASVQGGDYGITTRESVGTNGTEANWGGMKGYISEDGRWVAFTSISFNLVDGDTNGNADVFLRDRVLGTTIRISVSNTGVEGDGASQVMGISADGQWVVFTSKASNLVPNDTNEEEDVFLWDRSTATLSRVSVSSSGGQGSGGRGFSTHATISADGRYIAFFTTMSGLVLNDTNNADDVFVHNRISGETRRISVSNAGTEGNSDSDSMSISAEGRYITFESEASNLVPGDTNGKTDIFLYDYEAGVIERVSRLMNGGQTSDGSFSPVLSGDGRMIAFTTAQDLETGDNTYFATIYLYDQLSDTLTLALDGGEGNRLSTEHPLLSYNGERLFFNSYEGTLVPNDTNGVQDVFELNLLTGSVQRLSLSSYDEQGFTESYLTDVSDDGHFVTWSSSADAFVEGDTNQNTDVFLRERSDTPAPTYTPTVTITPSPTVTPRIPPYPNEQMLPILVRDRPVQYYSRTVNVTQGANGASRYPVLSADGQILAFVSAADNLVAGDTNEVEDVFVWFRGSNTFRRISVASDGTQADHFSYDPAISADGRYVAFVSRAGNLAVGDTNEALDIYRHDLQTGVTEWVSQTPQGTGGTQDSYQVALSGDGNMVAFTSLVRELVSPSAPRQCTNPPCIYIRDMMPGETTAWQRNTSAKSPSISADGRVLMFQTYEYIGNYTLGAGCYGPKIYRVDLATGQEIVVAESRAWYQYYYQDNFEAVRDPRLSPDGHHWVNWYDLNLYSGEQSHGLRGNRGNVVVYGGSTYPIYPKTGCAMNAEGYALSLSYDGSLTTYSDREVAGGEPSNVWVSAYDGQRFRVSTVGGSTEGAIPNGASYQPYIASDGKTVAYVSEATDIVAGDSNGVSDIYLWEKSYPPFATYTPTAIPTQTATPTITNTPTATATPRTSPYEQELFLPIISRAGRLPYGTSLMALYTGYDSAVALDGGWVGYLARIPNPTGYTFPFALWSSRTNESELYSLTEGEPYSDVRFPELSADGRWLLYIGADYLPQYVVLADMVSGEKRDVRNRTNGTFQSGAVSRNGEAVFSTSASGVTPDIDINQSSDVFLYDWSTNQHLLISKTIAGGQSGNYGSYISDSTPDGRYVLFLTFATDIVEGGSATQPDLVLYDRVLEQYEVVSLGNEGQLPNGITEREARMSPDARYIVFESGATNLVAGDTNGVRDIFIRDRIAGTTRRVSVGNDGVESNGDSKNADLTNDGRQIVFQSDATNLVVSDDNNTTDVFLHDIGTGRTHLLSRSEAGEIGNDASYEVKISGDGLLIVFNSMATNLTPSGVVPPHVYVRAGVQ